MTQSTDARGNDAFAWSEFDPEAYFAHYYGDPHPDDDRLVALTSQAILASAESGCTLDVIDIGTGPNLFPLFAAFPCAASITVWEYADSNLTWLRNELAERPDRPQWRHFWEVARAAPEARSWDATASSRAPSNSASR